MANDKGTPWGLYLLGAGVIGAGLYFLFRPKQAEAKLPGGPSQEEKFFGMVEAVLSKVVEKATSTPDGRLSFPPSEMIAVPAEIANNLLTPSKKQEIFQKLKKNYHDILTGFNLSLSIKPVTIFGTIRGSSLILGAFPATTIV